MEISRFTLKLAGLSCGVVLGLAPVGCVEESAAPEKEPSSEVLTIDLTVATAAELPTCDSKLSGATAFVVTPPGLYRCMTSKWVEVQCFPGATGTVAYSSVTETLVACTESGWRVVTLPPGPQGPEGPKGEKGDSTLVNVESEPPGSNCAAGGQRIEIGLDTNKNGKLDPDEVTKTAFVCSGMDGAPGMSSLVEASTEPAGTNCAHGGTKIVTGVDTSKNGTLDASEVTHTSYVCNGAPGFTTLVSASTEPAGQHCATGGLAIASGADTNKNGTLDASEISGTSYVCNGAPGANGLVSSAPEPLGANCPDGGLKVTSGVDANKNGALDPSEVTSTSYVCNAPGAITTCNSSNWIQFYPNLENCDLRNASLAGVSFASVKLNNAKTHSLVSCPPQLPTGYVCKDPYPTTGNGNAAILGPNLDLSGADFTGWAFGSLDLSGSNLSGAALTNADLLGVKLTGAKLNGTLLSGAKTGRLADCAGIVSPEIKCAQSSWFTASCCSGGWGVNWNCYGCNPASGGALLGPGVSLESIINLSGGDMAGVNLSGSTVYGSNFGVGLAGANFSNATLTKTSLSTNLAGANFSNAKLGGVDLSYADLTGVDLALASIDGVRMSRLKVCPAAAPPGLVCLAQSGGGFTVVGPGVDLDGADLTGLDLSSVSLKNAYTAFAAGCPALPPAGGRCVPGKKAGTFVLAAAGAVISGNVPAGTDLSGTNLGEARLSLLSSVNFGGANLTAAELYSADGANFAGANLTGAKLNGNFTGANFAGANLTSAALLQVNLAGADLTSANLTGTNLSSTSLTGTKFAGTDLTTATLKGAQTGALASCPSVLPAGAVCAAVGATGKFVLPAPGVSLSQAALAGVSLAGANLAGAALEYVDLTGGSLAGADLSAADLSGAKLISADLTNANFTNADLGNANLTSALTTGATWTGAKFFSTKCPGGNYVSSPSTC